LDCWLIVSFLLIEALLNNETALGRGGGRDFAFGLKAYGAVKFPVSLA
jgi:hypothetical protein